VRVPGFTGVSAPISATLNEELDGFPSGNCIDASLDTVCSSKSSKCIAGVSSDFCQEGLPTLEIDLGQRADIGAIFVYNKLNSLGEQDNQKRIVNAKLYLWALPGGENTAGNVQCGTEVLFPTNIPGSDGCSLYVFLLFPSAPFPVICGIN
jgi:hypothetical protein